jgi:hypothetical protein
MLEGLVAIELLVPLEELVVLVLVTQSVLSQGYQGKVIELS